MPATELICPICQQKKKLDISSDSMNNVKRGLLAINIAPEIVCSHSFIAYIDKNFNVRDYFTADFHIELPELNSIEKVKSVIPSKDVFDIDLIRLNISALLLTYILKSIFSKKRILLISDQEFLYEHIRSFFKYISNDFFEVDIYFVKESKYKSKKKDFKDAMIFKGNEIINNSKKIINKKKMLVEKFIVNKFFSEHDLGYGYIILRNEIHKAWELSKSIIDYLNSENDKGSQINLLQIQTDLEKKYTVKINTFYFRFLIEIVSNYFGLKVPSMIDGFFNFL